MKITKFKFEIFFFLLFLLLNHHLYAQLSNLDNNGKSIVNSILSQGEKIKQFQLDSPFKAYLFLVYNTDEKFKKNSEIEKFLINYEKITFTEIEHSTLSKDLKSGMRFYKLSKLDLPIMALMDYSTIDNENILNVLNQSIDFEKKFSHLFLMRKVDVIKQKLTEYRSLPKQYRLDQLLIEGSDQNLEDQIKQIGLNHQYGIKDYSLIFMVINKLLNKKKYKDIAKIYQRYLDPVLELEQDTYPVERYFLTLGRIFYQAQMHEQSMKYYQALPAGSKLYMQAQVENFWNLYHLNQYSKMIGLHFSEKMNISKDHNNPYLPLGLAASQLKLCQYSQVQFWTEHFISRVKKYKIEPKMNLNDYYYSQLRSSIKSEYELFKEKKFSKLGLDNKVYSQLKIELDHKRHILMQKQKIVLNEMISTIMTKFRLVKIELLSELRKQKKSAVLAKLKSSKQDQVQLTVSASEKIAPDTIDLPLDDVLFGDEVFSIDAREYNLCAN